MAIGYEPLNVNTASATVLRCLADGIKKNHAESLYMAHGKPFENIEDFLKDEAMAHITVDKKTLSVASSHFLLSGQIDMGKNSLDFQAQLKRNNDKTKDNIVSVVKRARRSSIDD